jgi:hypothetical protein
MIASFALDAKVDFRKFRLRFVDFLVRIWVLYALFRLTLPVPVIINLFLEELWLFNFGMDITSFTILIACKINHIKAQAAAPGKCLSTIPLMHAETNTIMHICQMYFGFIVSP